ncbi:bacillithiol biosynthesis cysteine-adding enzyme BshC [Lysinibacillus sp. KU-BSD001]|uniref:bacillithiol biosynthesis cysteine-adding enzyme BshC n=1 Tax=Lysinibacillus sp. KU-BSD001 TaxID=3141328 RepID=UPI0036E5C6E2
MKLEQISLPVNNEVLADYWNQEADIHSFFAYPFEKDSFAKRVNTIHKQSYKREALVQVIRSYMEPFGVSKQAEKHLQELEEGALAIVGGQQAGVFTGPLYSVYKAITVILLAHEQRQALKLPVVPVFWIAGEDHDLEEINHTFTAVEGALKKRGYSKRSNKKTMASTTTIDHEAMEQLIKTVFEDYGETAYTEALLHEVLEASRCSQTFTDFFTTLMNRLFAAYGLLMIDAAYEPLRELESDYFARLIEHNEEIAQVVVAQEQALQAAGYGKPIEATSQNANLFYIKDGERFLLERKDGYFVNALAQLKLTKEELVHIAKHSPEKLSNNVVTRPLMQEMVFPVLAFVGGPGELAYWATLGRAFSTLNLEMPIFAPRLNISVVTRKVQPLLDLHQLTFEDVVAGKATQAKERFIASVQDEQVIAQVEEMQEALLEQYKLVYTQLANNELHLDQTIEKNKAYHIKQFAYLKNKISEQTLQKHSVAIRQFNIMNAEIFPHDSLQERIFNPYQLMNQYGPTFVEDLMKLPLNIGPEHYVVIC